MGVLIKISGEEGQGSDGFIDSNGFLYYTLHGLAKLIPNSDLGVIGLMLDGFPIISVNELTENQWEG